METQINIELKGVRTHNLKIDQVQFPLGKMTVVTGMSGSGKSSLVFDTIYSESYRRYVENLSSFARQYLKTFPKPSIEACRNLPPSIAIKQHQGASAVYNNRSTVGSLTEMTDLLRVIFTHLGEIECRSCLSRVRVWAIDEVLGDILSAYSDKSIFVMAPLSRYHAINAEKLAEDLVAQGFSRVFCQGNIKRLSDIGAWDVSNSLLVVDRIRVDAQEKGRIYDALQLAFKVGQTHMVIQLDAMGRPDGKQTYYSKEPRCIECKLDYKSPSMALLSSNHPLGACESCQGFGQMPELDWNKIIPNKDSSLAMEGVAAWNFGQFKEYYSWAQEHILEIRKMALLESAQSAEKKIKKNRIKHFNLSDDLFSKKFSDYTLDEWQWIKEGGGRTFDGILGFIRYLESKKYKPHYRIHLSRFRKYVPCNLCNGDRLSQDALAIKLAGLNMAEVQKLTIEKLFDWTNMIANQKMDVGLSNRSFGHQARLMGVREAIEDSTSRIQFLLRLGLGYLTLERQAKSLSGGELQRIHLGRCLGSALEDTLYCLDEPTTGLHPRDSHQLLSVVRELLSGSNTVIMVEHDLTLLQGADYVVEIGPKAGADGGLVVYQGRPQEWSPANFKSPLIVGGLREKTRFLNLKGGNVHNLKNVSIRIPLGHLSVICGISGSGKTSLAAHCLFPALSQILEGVSKQIRSTTQVAEKEGYSGVFLGEEANGTAAFNIAQIEPKSFVREHRGVMLVSQGALARSSRSNISTYLGIMEELRKLMAKQPDAKQLGLSPSSFSFNTPGGRCETCKGLGLVVEDLSFLGDVEVTCPSCQGRRFSDQVLSVTYKGLSLNQIFELTVRQARDFFVDRPAIRQICDRVAGMGLGYLTLGQSTSSFSGGEAQRLKLLSILAEDMDDTRPMFLIFDEPTRGLSKPDVKVFLEQLQSLTSHGHCVVVVEHNLDVIKAADWLIEVGPEAAQKGGEILFMGTFEEFKKNAPPESATRPFV